ncbi:HipA domain-containing protein, partial [mine drainage metagenome]
WLLAAPDGHAKNFSLFIEQGGRYRMTPLYDVMSAWPVIGVGPNKFDRKKLKLAMGVRGKNMHYLLDEIRRQHWNTTAKRNAMGIDFEEDIALLLKKIPDAINVVARHLPSGFPAQVSDSIFEGIRTQAGRLAEMGQLDGSVNPSLTKNEWSLE